MQEDIFIWLQNWYQLQCDGEWEHEFGIKIHSIDNPGWSIQIDLKFTELEKLEIDYKLVELSKSDWYGYSVKNSVFNAGGDPAKLSFLLKIFRDLYLQHAL